MIKKQYPDRDVEVDKARFQTYEAARKKLELEERIAGVEFGRRLGLYRALVEVEVDKGRYAEDPIGEEAYRKARESVTDRSREILRLLDEGGLYFPDSGKLRKPRRADSRKV